MKMNNKICLDENYSTTRLLVKGKHEITNNPEDNFESVLFLPENKERKGEAGLRAKGYFKNQGSGHNPLLLEKLSYNISNKTNGILWQEDLD